jgi:hypothetical protein
MIIVRLLGGLGNQLFQYAAGRSLAVRKKTQLYLDVSAYGQERSDIIRRSYDLGLFNIDAPFATSEQVRRFTRPPFIRQKMNRLLPYHKRGYYKELFFHYDPDFFTAAASTLLEGYWQSEKYFSGITDILLDEFRVTAPLSAGTGDLISRIKSSNSVSVHIRRGDYVNNPVTLEVHGLCGADYYTKALSAMAGMTGDIELFVFSDDMEWTRQNITAEFPVTYVDHNDSSHAYEDLYLMSLCKHNIIANSSFSWWGAWLNANPDKTVVAPSRWFNRSDADTSDLLPAEWIKL